MAGSGCANEEHRSQHEPDGSTATSTCGRAVTDDVAMPSPRLTNTALQVGGACHEQERNGSFGRVSPAGFPHSHRIIEHYRGENRRKFDVTNKQKPKIDGFEQKSAQNELQLETA
jgi:hypothetical protein